MLVDVKIPEISENVTSGTVVSIHVRVGDGVKVDDVLIELETDKAVVEIPSTIDGVVRELLVAEGEEKAVGEVIARIDTVAGAGAAAGVAGDAITRTAPEALAAPEAPAAPVEQPPPVSAAAEETPAPAATPEPPQAPPTTMAAAALPERSRPPIAADKVPAFAPVPAAPSVRRLARELGIDLGRVPASGPGGHLTADDVKAYARGARTAESTPAVGAPATAPELPDFTAWGPVEVVPLAGIRKITAANMATAWQTVPHVTQFDEADVTAVAEFIRREARAVEKAGGKLTLTAVLVKILAAALKQFPAFNASIDAAAQSVVLKRYVHIGVAAATDHGLLVPVVRDADRKNITQIAVEIVELAGRARNRKIQPREMEGASFTISNQGGIGGVAFTPIVNWPQVAILGVSRTAPRQRPVGEDGQFAARQILPLSLSYDHRLIDGADAARFLRWICQSLEAPLTLMLASS